MMWRRRGGGIWGPRGVCLLGTASEIARLPLLLLLVFLDSGGPEWRCRASAAGRLAMASR